MQAQILSVLTGYLLDVRSVRQEIERREACGQWVAGANGEGGAFAMRSAQERAQRTAAALDDEARSIPPLSTPCQSMLCQATAAR